MKKIIFYLVILNISVLAQMSELEILPHHINFVNNFERISTINITNYGTVAISIDSIDYDVSMVYVRNNNFSDFPISIEPDSSISIDVQLSNYFTLTGEDSTTVLTFFNSSSDSIKYIDVYVAFKMYHRPDGIIRGTVKDSSGYISDAKLFFFFDGIYLIDSAITDNNGNYEKELRTGDYFVLAQKEGYYLQYAELKNSPLEADFIEVVKDTPRTVDFMLEPEVQTNLSITGVVYDIVTDETLDEAIVIVRTGTHTPTKRTATTLTEPSRNYTVMTNSKGEFVLKNIIAEGEYYLQAFSQYYIPGYYNQMERHETFWQNADSVSVFGVETGKNIYLERDSSYGGGYAKGYVRRNESIQTSVDDALIYAVSTANQKVYNYNFSKSSGEFDLSNLPSGSYQLITDKFGYDNSVSSIFTIDTTQDTVDNIVLLLEPTSVENNPQPVEEFSLSQNYPNPFNPSTVIEFTIAKNDNISLTVYNLLGQKVAELFNSYFNAGTYKVKFDASRLPSGVYVYQLKSSTKILAKKMELIK